MDELQVGHVELARWCLIVGQTGSGKSHLVRRLAFQWHSAGVPCTRPLAGGVRIPHRWDLSKVVHFAPGRRGPEDTYAFVPPAFRYLAFDGDVVAELLAEQQRARARDGSCPHVLVILSDCATSHGAGFFAQPAMAQLACQARHLNVHVLMEEQCVPADVPLGVHANLGPVFCFAVTSAQVDDARAFFDGHFGTPGHFALALLARTQDHACLVKRAGFGPLWYRAPAQPPGPFRMGELDHWTLSVPRRLLGLDFRTIRSPRVASAGRRDPEHDPVHIALGPAHGSRRDYVHDSDQDSDDDCGGALRVYSRLRGHQVPAGRVMLVLGGEGKTHLVKGLAREWHVDGARRARRGQDEPNVRFGRVFCFGPRVDQEYGFVPPSCRHEIFSEQAILDLVKSQGRHPPDHALVIVDGCAPAVLRTAAMRRLFELAEAAKVHVVVTGPHCVTLPLQLRAHVDVCLLLHTHNWAHRKLCFVQWGGRAFESLRAFDRAFDSLTDDFACMVLGKGQRVGWYRAPAGSPPSFRMGLANHWHPSARARARAQAAGAAESAPPTPARPEPVPATCAASAGGECTALAHYQCAADRGVAPEAAVHVRRTCLHSVRPRDVDTRVLAVVGAPGDTPRIVRGLACEWQEHGVRSTAAPGNVRFAHVFCFTDRPDAFDFVPASAHCGAFDPATVRALVDRQRCEWAADDSRWDRRRPVLCIVDRCTNLDMQSGAVRDLARTGALFGMHLVMVVDADTVVPPALLDSIDTCFCARGAVPAVHARLYRQWLPHLGTQVEREAALEALSDAHSCLVVELAGPCLKAGAYHAGLPALPVHVPSEDDGAAGAPAAPPGLPLTQPCTEGTGLPTAPCGEGAAAPAGAMSKAAALFHGLAGSCTVM
jgi:hypothetical protein